ncbi:single-stranded-DNA-specific exonuclease RecJ [Natronospora cellulosivora (SeqCode)]
MLRKQWTVKKSNDIIEFNDINPILMQILAQRGIDTKEEIKSFLYGDEKNLEDPFLLVDMDHAINRIITAIENNQKIIVFGDYDVDGISSTALLYTYFKEKFNYKLDYYLPDRQREGYGLNLNAINSFIKDSYDLLITVDCGITALNEVSYASANGLDVIVTDHHQAADELPEALAVIDPHRDDDAYPFKDFAGVGVAFKLCQALEYKVESTYYSSLLEELLEIVALGTVADIVPLKGENRIFVKKGLEIINKKPNTGLKMLIDLLGLNNKKISTGHIAFMLAPHLNAAGRIANPEEGIKLLIERDNDKAKSIALNLRKANQKRQDIEKRIFEEAKEMVEEMDLEKEKAIILASDKWHHGVIGIVASKIVELYYRPTILIAIDGHIGKGSCRSIKSLNIHKALLETLSYLESFGGHKMAAGLSIAPNKIDEFREIFNNYLNNKLTDEDLIAEMKVDAVLEVSDITNNFYKNLSQLEPYGMANSRPKFVLLNTNIDKAYPVGKEKKHIKFLLENKLNGIGFGFGDYHKQFLEGKVDIAFHLDINTWQNQKNLQLCLEDFKIREDLNTHPVYFETREIKIADKRGCQNHSIYIKKLMNLGKKVLLYANDLRLIDILKKEIDEKYFFTADKSEDLRLFEERTKGLVIVTPSSDLNLYGVNIDEFVFSSMPFSLKEMKSLINKFELERLNMHLIFTEESIEVNCKIIKNSLPSAEYLREFYYYTKTFLNKSVSIDQLHQFIKDRKKIRCNKTILKYSIKILNELGLIKINNNSIKISREANRKLDLSSSISYNEIIDKIKQFDELKEIMLQKDLFPLISKISFR